MPARRAKTRPPWKGERPRKAAPAATPLELRLAALGDEKAAARPKQPVAVVAAAASRLAGLGLKERSALLRLPGFDAAWVDDLEGWAQALTKAENAWQAARAALRAGTGPRRLKEGRKLRGDLVESARYLLRREAASQKRLDDLAGGSGAADLASDLNALAELVESRAAVFAADPELPEDAAARARALAEQILLGTDPTAATDLLPRRNLLSWLVLGATGELRRALRFLWRRQPEKLATIGVSYGAQNQRALRARRRAAKTKTG